MPKYLIMTLGTGENVEHGLALSISTLNPDSILCLGSTKSYALFKRLKSSIPDYVDRFKPMVIVADENDVEKCTIDARNILLELIEGGVLPKDIEVDFTSGTKAMTAGLCIAAVSLGVGKLVYVSGERDAKTGRVITGTERVFSVYPTRLMIQNKRQQLQILFNKRLFVDGLRLIEETMLSCKLPEIQEEFSSWKLLFESYYYWDICDHIKANKTIEKIPSPHLKKLGLVLSGNKEILGKISSKLKKYKNNKKTSAVLMDSLSLNFALELLADILANAERRGKEGKYDDAVARLYRASELIVQIALAEHKISTSKLSIEHVQNTYKNKVLKLFPELSTKKIAIGQDKSYKLLEVFDSKKAQLYLGNRKLQTLLSKRNLSILAHGLSPVDENIYTNLKSEVLKLARAFNPKIDDFLAKASFPEIKVTL